MGEINKPVIVVSSINIFEGGPLTILKECLDSLETTFQKEYRIIAFVHRADLFQNFKNIHFLELPKSRESWLHRIYYEYYYFKKMSRKIKPYLWLSLHDTSPLLVNTARQCVYCHNPSIFYRASLSELAYDKKHVLFSFFYKFLYRINQKSNRFLIVQQDWIREKFHERYNFPLSNIVVAYPNHYSSDTLSPSAGKEAVHGAKTFIYAAFPRIFKNYEVIVEAARILAEKGITDFQVKFTLNGSENEYAQKIKTLSKGIDQITFLGLMPRELVLQEYKDTDALIFPSKLETWGLPITEFKALGKPIFAASLEYASETVGNYDKVSFFPPEDPKILADKMELAIKNKGDWQKVVQDMPAQPFTTSWDEMINFILKN
jgi:glycosyltransferase involved in cell wall biosynthesis